MSLFLLRWPHGPLHIVFHDQHMGLFKQWTIFSNHSEIQLFLEDDLIVSTDFYVFVKEAIKFYYLDDKNYDENTYGLSLQNQHTILGRTDKGKLPNMEAILENLGMPTFFRYQLLGSSCISLFPVKY